jgi:hypothetical protein
VEALVDAVVWLSLDDGLARRILFDATTMLIEMGFQSGQITATGATDELTAYRRIPGLKVNTRPR